MEKENVKCAKIEALVDIHDENALWEEAYQSIKDAGKVKEENIYDLIGTKEKPDVISCLKEVISQPNRIPGTIYIEVNASPFDGMFPPR